MIARRFILFLLVLLFFSGITSASTIFQENFNDGTKGNFTGTCNYYSIVDTDKGKSLQWNKTDMVSGFCENGTLSNFINFELSYKMNLSNSSGEYYGLSYTENDSITPYSPYYLGVFFVNISSEPNRIIVIIHNDNITPNEYSYYILNVSLNNYKVGNDVTVGYVKNNNQLSIKVNGTVINTSAINQTYINDTHVMSSLEFWHQSPTTDLIDDVILNTIPPPPLECGDNEICQLNTSKANSQLVGEIGNTFKISGIAPIYINYIRMAVSRSEGYGSDVPIYIDTTSGGLPTDNHLATETTNYTGIPVYPSYEFVPLFTGNLSISPDVEYAFYTQDVETEATLYVWSAGFNNYIDGTYVNWSGSGNWHANSSDDVAFIIGYTASSLSKHNETYVKWNGSDSNDGTSWAYAFRHIDFAVNYTNNYSTSIIHIAPGNYSTDPWLNKRTLARFKCDTNGPAQNASQIWCRYPRWNMTHW